MSKEMLINVAEGEECRVAIVDQGRLEELYIERVSYDSHVGNIYKGKITNIEASIQAAFVDFGTGKNGFLHISDIHPRYFPNTKTTKTETLGKRKALKDRMPIQKCLKKGQEVIVQVTKESVKTKGPSLSTYLSFPGKYLVMMPWMKQSGISHKIEDEEERKRLRKILNEVSLPKDVGFIVRTAGQGSSKRDIQNDLKYLLRLWKSIEKQIKTAKNPSEIYQESDLVIRTLRNVFNSDISKIICDCEEVFKRIRKFLSIATPRLKRRLSYYDGKVPLFHKYKIEDEITKVQSREVDLKGGGSIVIEQTEALVAIDVNSGKYRKQQSAEETAYNINLKAADEIARQLRLRDLGGLVICDFIDMRDEKHRKAVERQFRLATKADRARSKVLRISQFGVVEMTRQRMRPSLQSSTYLECPTCRGKGFIKNNESIALEIIRLLNLTASNSKIKSVELFVSHEVADYLQNERRAAISKIESNYDKKITIRASASYGGENHNVVCYNARGSVIKL
ncbi:MAG: Rne/Rng family ribonuclease [Planctomycetes bacterium]|nr:Rne/Rng family ribonuclease [Planctomycetota bacterium]